MTSCFNSIVIDAPCDDVWRALRDFHDFSWAPDIITDVQVIGDLSGNQVGAKRILNGAFHETLLEHDDDARVLSYQIDDGPGPVSKDAMKSYIGWVYVAPITADNSTYVEWTSSYEAQDSIGVEELCNPIYRALLGSLKGYFSR